MRILINIKTWQDNWENWTYCYRGTWDNPKRISWPSWKHRGESWCGSDSKDRPIRNSTNPPTGYRLLRLQDVTCSRNWLPVEHWEYIHNNNNKEKLSKYNDLKIEFEKTWRLKATTVPVVIGALGLVKKGTENYISKIPGNIRITELQKIVLLGPLTYSGGHQPLNNPRDLWLP